VNVVVLRGTLRLPKCFALHKDRERSCEIKKMYGGGREINDIGKR
jgi:hypothetical protein